MSASIITTDVYGTKDSTGQLSKIGKIFSELSLESAGFEMVTLELSNDFKGIESGLYNNGGSIMTFAKTIGGVDRDIVSPIVLVTSSYRNMAIHVLDSGVISHIAPPNIKHPVIRSTGGSCSIVIITAGRTPTTVTEWSIHLPADMRLDRKIVYIKKFNIYISGCSYEQMQEIRDNNILIAKKTGAPKSIVDISIKGNIDTSQIMFYNFNGIYGKVNVEPCVEPIATVTLRVGSKVLTESIPNRDLINSEFSIFKYWSECGGIELIIDYDKDRLSRTYDQICSSSKQISPEDIGLIRELQSEIVKLNKIIRDRDDLIRTMQLKIDETERNLKLKQEELKTRREEIRYHGSIADQRNSSIIDAIKIGGAILGTISLIVTLITKQSANTMTKKNLVEWSIPQLFVKRFSESSIQPTPMITGVGVGIVIGFFVCQCCEKMMKPTTK